MKKKKVKKKVNQKEGFINGKIYHVEFLDHCLCGGDIDIKKVYCETYGRVLDQDDEVLLMTFWDLPSHDMKTRMGNQERMVILKSAIRNYQLVPDLPKRSAIDLEINPRNRELA